MGWETQVKSIQNWEPWIYTEEEKRIAAAKKRELPEIELGSMHYSPTWAENIRFNVVVKRTKAEKTTLFEQDVLFSLWSDHQH